MSASSPIVVLDSGLGGLTVVRALQAKMPDEDIVYFGDTARLPYGSKTEATVSSFVQQIISYLLPIEPKHVVFACNTATALALPFAQAMFPDLPMSGVIEPGAKAAAIAAGARRTPNIAVLATEATARSGAYERAIHGRRFHARLWVQAAPLLVPLIEDGRLPEDPLTRLALHQYLHPLRKRDVNVLVLGCTHYPIYKELIQEMVGKDVPVIDSAEQCAEDVARRLRKLAMLRRRRSPDDYGQLRCFVTDDPLRFQRLAPRFLGVEIDEPSWIAPEELYNMAPLPQPRTMPMRMPA